jgi:phosphatidylglycerol:prolipoprotein diacylglycerol transferase
MIEYPNIDPVAISIGSLNVHWYGLMYVIGFAAFLILGKYRAKKAYSPVSPDNVDDMMFYGALGVVLGGRIGYVLFYNFSAFLDNPLTLFQVWHGGMSFHGGLIGVITVMLLLSRRWEINFLRLSDFVAPLVPIGLGAGRLGNFINGNLWGKPTDMPWGMVFPHADNLARHPSQLYQMFLEGILLFIILWVFSGKQRPAGSVAGLFLVCYGVFRFIVEFVRVPDVHIGYIAWDWLTKGQLLSLPMILLGLALITFAYRTNNK